MATVTVNVLTMAVVLKKPPRLRFSRLKKDILNFYFEFEFESKTELHQTRHIQSREHVYIR